MCLTNQNTFTEFVLSEIPMLGHGELSALFTKLALSVHNCTVNRVNVWPSQTKSDLRTSLPSWSK